MAFPIIIPIVGGVALAGTAVALRIRAVAKAKAAKTSTLSPAQQAAIAQPLPVAVQTVLKTRGPDPDQATINTLKIEQAAGTLDISQLLKGTDGTVFVKTSPQMQGQSIPDNIASQILAGDKLTVDVAGAGLQIPAIPSGNMLFLAKSNPNLSARTIQAAPIDPRVQDNGPTISIPIGSITGIEPGS